MSGLLPTERLTNGTDVKLITLVRKSNFSNLKYKADHKKLLVCCTPTYPSKLALPKNFMATLENIVFKLKKKKKKDSVSDKCSNQLGAQQTKNHLRTDLG